MTTTTIANYSSWNDSSSYTSLDCDELFSSRFAFIDDEMYDLTTSSNTVQHEETYRPFQLDLQELQISAMNNMESHPRLSDLVCGVCGAPAVGYNFDQITCESCKAFFRRNALRHMPDLKCRFTGSCEINVHTRRQCTYCRLQKCFDIKMRKDWIRTEEETKLRQLQKLIQQERKRKQSTGEAIPAIQLPLVVRKKKRLLTKSFDFTRSMLTGTHFDSHHQLSDVDHAWLNNVNVAYQSAANQADGMRFNHYTESTSLTEFIDKESAIHESLIKFYKKVPEFKGLDLQEQVSLIKSNLLNLIHVHDILIQNFSESPIIGKLMSKWISEDFHEQMSRARQSLYRFAEHPLILKLALIVFLFSVNECDNRMRKIDLQKIQNLYKQLLWRYLNHLYDDQEATRSMDLLTRQISKFHSLMDTMEKAVRSEPSSNISDELMRSVFRLT